MTDQPLPPGPSVTLYPAPEGGLPGVYGLLSQLLLAKFLDNPKKHQPELIKHSVRQHGFNDPVGLDVERNMLVAGHGRCEALESMRGDGERPPKNIFLLEGGDWFVPVVPLKFDSIQSAIQYVLADNRAGVTHLHPEDYDGVKLSRALKLALAGAGSQVELPGFGGDDMVLGGSVSGVNRNELQLPAGPAFDAPPVFEPGKLEGGIGYQDGQAPQSYVVLVTLPSWADLRRAMRALTLGARAGLTEDARQVSVEGSALLPQWEALLLKETAANEARVDPVKSGALPGQITMAGAVVGDKPADTPLIPEHAISAVVPFPGIHAGTEITFAEGAPGSAAWEAQANEPPPPQHSEEDAAGDPYAGGQDPEMSDDGPVSGGLSPEEQAELERALAGDEGSHANSPSGPVVPTAAQAEPALPMKPAAPPVVIAGPYAGLPVPAVAKVVQAPQQAAFLPEATPSPKKSKKPDIKADQPVGANEPKWVGKGNTAICPKCGGSEFLGYTGPKDARVKVPCDACDSTGTRGAWLKKQGLA